MDQLKCLRVFVQVVADGSFAGAARHLDIAPAVATRALAERPGSGAAGRRGLRRRGLRRRGARRRGSRAGRCHDRGSHRIRREATKDSWRSST